MRAARCSLALALLVACGGDDSTGPRTIAGTYLLHSIQGDEVPILAYEEPGYTVEILSGNVVLKTDGSFTDTHTVRETEGSTVTDVTFLCTGTWTQSGSSLTLIEEESEDCGVEAGVEWDGDDTLTVDWAYLGIEAVYRR